MTAGPAMRIAELARRTGVSRETIHFYLREGLIPRPRKTGRNMAWYDASHVERIQAIKRLQNEKFLPLSVIKRVLLGDRPERVADVELLSELFRLTGERSSRGLATAQLARAAKVPPSLVRAAAAAGLLAPEPDERARPVHGQDDVELLQLLHALADDAGFGESFAVELARSAATHVRDLVRDEAGLVFGRFLRGDQPARAVEALKRSRPVVNRLVVALRARLMQRQIGEYFEQLEGAITGSEHLAIAPLGAAALRRTRFGALERDLQARARARPGDDDAALRLCALWMGVGQFDRATAEAERALVRHPGHAALLRAAGACRFEIGDDDAAITHLSAGAERSASDPLVHAYLGSAWLRRARDRVATLGAAALAEAGAGIAALTHSRALPPASRPDELRVALVRGRVYGILPSFLGMYDEGLAELRRIVTGSTSPGGPGGGDVPAEVAALAHTGELVWLRANAELLLAQLLEAAGRPAEAQASARSAADLDPDGPIAARAAKLLIRTGRTGRTAAVRRAPSARMKGRS